MRLARPVRVSRSASCSRRMASRPLWCSAPIGSISKMIDSGVQDIAWAASGPRPSSGADVAICQARSPVSTFTSGICTLTATATATKRLLTNRNAIAPARDAVRFGLCAGTSVVNGSPASVA